MPRFSVAFAKRKPTADDSENVDVAPPAQSSFRVLERSDFSPSAKPFDGGARMPRVSGALLPKPDFHVEDNMFADMKGNRGSGLSNTTHATSTDNSSRHSNTSTAPSSADFSGGNPVQDENRNVSKPSPETPGRPASRSVGSKFFDRAGRTFSFGGQKKHTIPPPKEDPVPDLPPVLTLKTEPARAESRGVTASTTSTAIPQQVQPDGGVIDLGGDFGSMFPSFDKRASMATLRNHDMASPRVLAGHQQGQPAPLCRSPDTATAADPLLNPWNTPQSSGAGQFTSNADSPPGDRPPPVPLHQSPSRFRPPTSASETKQEEEEDEDTKLLQETYSAIKLVTASDDFSSNSQPGRYRREEDSFTVIPRKQASTFSSTIREEDNLFEGSATRFPRPTHRYTSPTANNPPRNKVMTPAEFEKYRQDKIRHGSIDRSDKSDKGDHDEDEEINYDDDEDEAEKSKQQAKQRRKQEAHMAVYRQQMMKVTGETAPPPSRPGLPSSMSAPQLSHMKAPSPNLPQGASDEDEDEEVPLAILQAHGFPNKVRPPTRLSTMGSNPNMRASMHLLPGRPPSAMEDAAAASRRHSALPAFARNLPQDPFVGASIAKPALRESLTFSDATLGPKPPSPLPPGGLVGVIASEERARAMRRGSPGVDPRLMGSGGFLGLNGPGIDPHGGMPSHMYNQGQMAGGMQGMQGGLPHMMQNQMQQSMQQPMPAPPMLTVSDQAQLQMTQTMSQFMQMQMQFMQMMAGNPNGGMPQQQPYGGLPSNQSMVDLSSSRHSIVGEPTMEPRRMDYSMRTMSMVQPSSAPMVQRPGYAGSIRSSVVGYTPSIAPSERSNIGLPNRYRPVSQAAASPMTAGQHLRSGSLSGALSALGNGKGKTSMKVVNKSASTSDDDDDDEEGWEAMKMKREKKKSIWKSKRGLSSVF